MNSSPFRIAVLLSGTGSTLQNLIEQIQAGKLSVEIPLVISSRSHVLGVQRAKQAGIPVEIQARKAFDSLAPYSEAIFSACRREQIDLVVMAGFLQLIQIPNDFQWRVINVHPSLLPAFGGHGMYGHHVHEAVLQYGAKISGCTVHYADNEYDHGPILAQRAVEVLDTDTVDSLAARIGVQERDVYPQVIQRIADGKIRIEGRRVIQMP